MAVIRVDMLELMLCDVVGYSNRKFICIDNCSDLLSFWSYPQQCWQFALIIGINISVTPF